MQAGDGNPDPPHAYAAEANQRLPGGLYIITNRKLGVVLDLGKGLSKDGTWCMGFNRRYEDSIDHQLWSVACNEEREAYTFQNLRGGTFLTFPIRTPPLTYIGFQNVPTWLEGWQRVKDQADTLPQEWHIQQQPNGAFTVQCTGTQTFLDIHETFRMSPATCSPRNETNIAQLWNLERVSRTSNEIQSILLNWKPDLSLRIFQPYPDKAQYFVLPHELRRSLLSRANIHQQPSIEHAFDYDDFVIKAKDSMNSWARERLRVKGYSVLCGIVYGNAPRGPKMYNWYLTSDMRSLLFCDAQGSQEYTPVALEEFGFEPVFVTF